MRLPTSLPTPFLGLLAPLALALTLPACRPNPAPRTHAPAATATGPSPKSPAAPVPWSQMNHEQQLVYMREVVTPQMAKSFAAHDPQAFAQFNCATCHGPSAAQGEFEMPTPSLPRLGDFEIEKQEHPKDMAFMMEKVVPQMAKLLQEPAFDPKTQEGFGCFGCHLPAQDAG